MVSYQISLKKVELSPIGFAMVWKYLLQIQCCQMLVSKCENFMKWWGQEGFSQANGIKAHIFKKFHTVVG
jgi:hypothetical protein